MKQNRKINKPWWQIVGSLLLALSMFAYTGYSAITTMECLSSGEQSVTMGEGESESCCEMNSPSQMSIQAECCTFQTGEVTFFSLKTLHEELIPVLFTVPIKQIFAFTERVIDNRIPNDENFKHGPPLSGRQMLIQISKYTL